MIQLKLKAVTLPLKTHTITLFLLHIRYISCTASVKRKLGNVISFSVFSDLKRQEMWGVNDPSTVFLRPHC